VTHRTFDDPNSIEARQALLDNRCEDSKPKRHRVRKRSKKLAAKKRSRIKHANAVRAAAIAKLRAATRSYWLGLRAEHP
jgi:hypothetical protein